ncbi:arsenate reductase/protein-tyrosine-phosphatase family protein [Mycobacterium kiyosense]|nr:hypothetical protein [Mycobacterium kiyosense]
MPAAEAADFIHKIFNDPDNPIVSVRTVFKDPLPDNYPDPSTLAYGWRWYFIDGNRLVSPMVGRVPLPRNGVLDDVYFIPSAELMLQALTGYWRDVSPEAIRARGFALTFGRVYGPFQRDYNTTPGVGAMKCGRYEALAICTTVPEKFTGAYEIPIVGGTDLDTLRYVAQYWAQPAAVADPRLHVAFVCSFNVGRSVMAAAMFAHQLHERGLSDKVRVSNAGTTNWAFGSPMDERGAELLRANGYPVPTGHRSVHVNDDCLGADLVVVMEQTHVASLKQLGAAGDNVKLLRSFDPATPGGLLDLKNPYTGSDFAYCYRAIGDALPGLHRWVDEHLGIAEPTHGWRWYKVQDGRLVSPIVGATRYGEPITLPRSGEMNGVFFIPNAEMMSRHLDTIMRFPENEPEHLTLTFGRVRGPFDPDPNMGHVNAMRCARYEAQVIATKCPEKLAGAYDLPIVSTLDLAAIERRYTTMATKKQQAARAKFAKAARAKGNTKVGRRAKSTAAPKRKGGK